jgi:hypothetical protein
MAGYREDNEPQEPGQPAYVLGAWVHDQIADLEQVPLRHLADLQPRLRSTVHDWDSAPLAQALTALASAARELRFDDLRIGWFARRLGKHKPVYARFVAAHDRILAQARELRAQQSRLTGAHKDQAGASKRVLVDLGLESTGLLAGLEQGVGWLQDMWIQINRQREHGGADPDLANLAEAAEGYTQGFKRMQGIAVISREAAVRIQGLLDRRAALLELVRRDLEKVEGPWARAVGRVAAEMKAGRESIPGLAAAAEEHEQLMKRLETTGDSCAALQHEQHVAAQQLELLRRELDAPA